MEVDPGIDIAVYDGVYEPAGDTWLLLEAVEVRAGQRVLDMGTGTGVLALHAAGLGCEVTAADVDAPAVDNARCNAACNDLDVEVVQSDLFDAVAGWFDVIVFNPPYLPAGDGDLRWDGGRGGVATARRFLDWADGYLKRGGCIYLLLSSLGDIAGLQRLFSGRYCFVEKKRLPLFFERLVVYAVTPRGSGRAPTG